MRKLFILAFLLLGFSTIYAAPTCLGATPVKPGGFSLEIGMEPFLPTNNDPIVLFDVGFRLGLAKNWDWGIRFYKIGLITDLRYSFLRVPYFNNSLDLEICASQLYSTATLAVEFITAFEPSPLFNIYLAAKIRYQTIPEIDVAVPHIPTGIVFMPKLGVEFFRSLPLSLLIEAGFARGWDNPIFSFTGGAVLTWAFQ